MTVHLAEIAALVLALSGLAAVVAEILAKRPRALFEIATDVTAFAESAPQPMRFTTVLTRAAVDTAPANANLGRRAA